ncbi:TraB family protein [Euphorbia peplus]|nr:TraB family protein [Euphorbia peplus]
MNRWSRGVSRLKSAGLLVGTVSFGTLSYALLIEPSSYRTFSNVSLFSTHSVTPPPPPLLTHSSFVNVEAELINDTRRAHLPERRELPNELSRNVVVLTCDSTAEGGSCHVYLLGIVHGSQESCKQVQAILQSLKPEVVFLELCSRRKDALIAKSVKVPTMGDMIESWKKNHNLFEILYSWFLAQAKALAHLGVPRSEFSVAFEEARSYGAKVVLGDRPVEITLQRLWAKLPLWHTIKTVCSGSKTLKKTVKEMDDLDTHTMALWMQELRKEFPTLMEIVLDERDQYMSYTLRQVAREHSSVVAVVGKGHLAGIKKHWKQPIEALRLKEILEMPSQKAERV